MGVDWECHYDRRVPESFLEHFASGGVALSLTEYAAHAPFPLDLQFRHSPKTGSSHASLYVGLTSVLNIYLKGNDRLSLGGHATWTGGKSGFRKEWRDAHAVDYWRRAWREVEDYLERVIPKATATHATQEGTVQAAASGFSSDTRVMLDREAALHFADKSVKKDVMGEVTAPIVNTVKAMDGVPGKQPENFGGKCDLLAIDEEGSLLAIEVKPRGTNTIRWAAAQATVYAKLFRRWVETWSQDDEEPGDVLRGMLQQRVQLGLAKTSRPDLADRPAVIPVVAVQRGAPETYLEGLRLVHEHLLDEGVGDPALRMYEVNIAGRLEELPRL